MVACVGAAGTSSSSSKSSSVAALSVTPTTLPGGTVNSAYAATLTASGGSAPYSWSVSSGQLPAGVSLSAGGSLGGTPTSAGQFSFVVQVVDSASPQQKASANLSLTIASAPPPSAISITTTSLPAGTLNTSYSAALNASGGTTPYSWTLASGALPPGVNLVAGGQISGTPTAAGNYSFTVKVSDQSGHSASQPLSIAIGSASSGGQPTIPGASYDSSHGYYVMPASLASAGFSWSSGTLHNGSFSVTGWSGAVPSIVIAGSAVKVVNADYTASKSDSTTLSVQFEFDVGPNTAVIFNNSLGTGPGLLTGMTPNSHTIPSGWNLFVMQDFESGAVPSGQWIDGNFSTTQYHSDGNPAHTHSLGRTLGVDWNVQLTTGTKRVYASFYEYIDNSFGMNDEMFLYHVYQHPSDGDKIFVENILDWFQDSNGQYNSSDATLLWNIQGGVVDPATDAYYQLFQPAAHPGDWTMQTGRWVQWEMDQKFNSVLHFPAISGTVTVDATGKTFTRSSGSWVSDGVTVGMVLGFAGFTSNTFGGNNSTYKVTSVTPTTLTVSDARNLLTNETSSPGAIIYGSSNNDGAFTIYRDGVPVLSGTGINFTGGGADFSQNTTVLQLLGTYTKVIWRLPISGSSCQAQDTQAPWKGACASKIGGACGYETIPGGWNASCQTGTAQPIDCAPTPMPCPPVFNRYLDDVIVLTQ